MAVSNKNKCFIWKYTKWKKIIKVIATIKEEEILFFRSVFHILLLARPEVVVVVVVESKCQKMEMVVAALKHAVWGNYMSQKSLTRAS